MLIQSKVPSIIDRSKPNLLCW